MLVGGLFSEDKTGKTGAIQVIEISLGILNAVQKYNHQFGYNVKMRIGINTGSCIGGVIGKEKICFDVWGKSGKIVIVFLSSLSQYCILHGSKWGAK